MDYSFETTQVRMMLSRGTRIGLLRVLTVMVGLGLVAQGVSCRREPTSPPTTASTGVDGVGVATVKVVALGDSLTAGLGLSIEESYPTLLETRLRSAGYTVTMVNAGVSGDTSAGGLRRLEWALDGDVRVLIVALGANDALRGLPVADLQQNLATIIEQAQARHVSVVLVGMEAPPNLGPLYTAAFRRVYRELADRYDVPLVPFLLDGVAGVAGLNQADGVHPNAEGARHVAETLWPSVERAVRAAVTP
jgi:acyl-CoA thioesterase-1